MGAFGAWRGWTWSDTRAVCMAMAAEEPRLARAGSRDAQVPGPGREAEGLVPSRLVVLHHPPDRNPHR
eukprot:4079398-Prymnesium_polylepis.1